MQGRDKEGRRTAFEGGRGEGAGGREELMVFWLFLLCFSAAVGFFSSNLDSFVVTQVAKSVVDGRSGCAK